jgi:hypothetical protein
MTTDPFDSSPGLGFNEEELNSMRPFEPYKDTDTDELLALKMEMLRNRHKSNTLKKSSTFDISSQSKDDPDSRSPTSNHEKETQKIFPSPPIEIQPKARIEMKESENTAFSSRRSINSKSSSLSPVVVPTSVPKDEKSPPPPPQSQTKLETEVERKYVSLTHFVHWIS